MASSRTVRIGEPAPPFSREAVVCGNFEELSLEYYTERGQWLILMFIPMAFSFVCPTEVLAFSDSIDEFTSRGCAVAFISTDSKYSLQSWQNTSRREGGLGKIRVPLLSDQSHKMSRDYGVLLEDHGIALRGTFIIHPSGIVMQISINNLSVGRSVEEAIRLLDAYQATEKNGVVCPANWKRGESLLNTTHEDTQAYLDKNFSDLMSLEKPATSPTSPLTISRVLTPTPENGLVQGRISRVSAPISMPVPNVSPKETGFKENIFGHKKTLSAFSGYVSGNNSPLGSPMEQMFGHKKTMSNMSKQQSYFD